ncbi:MAG: hypothetical protein NXI32_09220 [bacterium]|nr:hypothetical protein [bacterium]
MSLIEWVPEDRHRFSGNLPAMQSPEENFVYQGCWVGEDCYDRKSGNWFVLQLFEHRCNLDAEPDNRDFFGAGQIAILHGQRYDPIGFLEVTREHCEDAIAFLGWPGFRAKRHENGKDMILYREPPTPSRDLTIVIDE